MDWEWSHSLLNVSSSIRAQFDLPCDYAQEEMIHTWLNQSSFRCLTVILIDGMGSRILEKYPEESRFFRAHMAEEVSTVYPPTTSAATTSLRTGKSPAENGWLGWNQYFKEEDDGIILFLGTSMYGDRKYGGTYAYEKLPIHLICDELNEKGIRAESIWPSWGVKHGCKDYKDQLNQIITLSNEPDVRYIYAYWDAFDSLMHKEGPSSDLTRKELARLNDLTEQFSRRLNSDTGVLILADHGQVDVTPVNLCEIPELLSCLKRPPALEGRTAAFYVREGMEEQFVRIMQERFADSFELLTHDQVVEQRIFGPGTPSPRFEEFIGDYLALAKTELTFALTDKQLKTKGDHAGMMDAERYIPIILLGGVHVQ
ncbi:MAG: alkaline phosphatase family protein [Solobacterium sp.]|nr:alkaline phosphatase family protein [Solobacterium sp.]